MPIYEYQCLDCGILHEIIQKMSDKPLMRCPRCSGKLQKLISQSTFHLKGSGWYATDYSKKSNNAAPSKKREEKSEDKKKEKSSQPDIKNASVGE
jgi:putative FmdB family regulatory protein